MADLNMLREAEVNAEKTIENARKDAQHISIQTPDIIERLINESAERFRKNISVSEEKIQQKVDKYAEELSTETKEKSIGLEKYIKILEDKAEVLLISTMIKKNG